MRIKNERWRWGGGGWARRTVSYYVRNISAEIATVLRKMATTLIRLREKLELQLCTVFHSARYPIILTRNAYQTQDDARSRFRSSRLYTITRQNCSKSNIQSREYKTEHNREARSCTSCITSTYSGSLFRKRNCVTTWKGENEQFLWPGRKRFGLTNSSSAY